MNTSYDLSIDTNGDIIFDTDIYGLEAQNIQNSQLVAQDIRRMIHIPRGALSWNTDAGSDILHNINAPSNSSSIENELLRIARADKRIDQESITAHTKNDVAILQFKILGETKIQEVLAS